MNNCPIFLIYNASVFRGELNSIIKTPTVYINGRELSPDYELEDLYRIYV